MLISLAVGETYEINGVHVKVRQPTKKHIELYVVKTPPGVNVSREGDKKFQVTQSS